MCWDRKCCLADGCYSIRLTGFHNTNSRWCLDWSWIRVQSSYQMGMDIWERLPSCCFMGHCSGNCWSNGRLDLCNSQILGLRAEGPVENGHETDSVLFGVHGSYVGFIYCCRSTNRTFSWRIRRRQSNWHRPGRVLWSSVYCICVLHAISPSAIDFERCQTKVLAYSTRSFVAEKVRNIPSLMYRWSGILASCYKAMMWSKPRSMIPGSETSRNYSANTMTEIHGCTSPAMQMGTLSSITTRALALRIMTGIPLS